jgi:hypothetical protein
MSNKKSETTPTFEYEKMFQSLVDNAILFQEPSKIDEIRQNLQLNKDKLKKEMMNAHRYVMSARKK